MLVQVLVGLRIGFFFFFFLGEKDLVIFFFLFGFERWGLDMVICESVGFFFFFLDFV